MGKSSPSCPNFTPTHLWLNLASTFLIAKVLGFKQELPETAYSPFPAIDAKFGVGDSSKEGGRGQRRGFAYANESPRCLSDIFPRQRQSRRFVMLDG